MLFFYMKEFQESDENLVYIIVVDTIDDVFQKKSTDQNCKLSDQYGLQKQADLQFPVFTFLKSLQSILQPYIPLPRPS